MQFFEYFIICLEDLYAYFLFYLSIGDYDYSYQNINPFFLEHSDIVLKISLYLTLAWFIGIGVWFFSNGHTLINTIRKSLNSTVKMFLKILFTLWISFDLLILFFGFFNFQIVTTNKNILFKVNKLKEKFELSLLNEKHKSSCITCKSEFQVDHADIIRFNEIKREPGKCGQCQGN
jgi:hypothetical protein